MKDDQLNYSKYSSLSSALMGIILVFCLRFFVIHPHSVTGHSMEPNFKSGQTIITSTIFKPERFDVVVAQSSKDDDSSKVLKRIIGLPGDTLEFKSDTLTINGDVVDEHYLDEFITAYESGEIVDIYKSYGYSYDTFVSDLKSFTTNDLKESEFKIILKRDEYFLIGDNRPVSKDSRHSGPFLRSDLKSEVILSIPKFK